MQTESSAVANQSGSVITCAQYRKVKKAMGAPFYD